MIGESLSWMVQAMEESVDIYLIISYPFTTSLGEDNKMVYQQSRK
jgi:hypothetical protein